MSIKFFEKLSNNYLELLDDNEDFNIIINVGEFPNTKIFQAHSAILRYRSLYFRNKLANINKDQNNIKTLCLNNIPIQQFEILIKYIYGGIVLFENHNASFIFELMLIAHEFLFDELAKYLETHLIEVETHWLYLHFTLIYQNVFWNNKLQKLQKWCNDIVVKYPDYIFEMKDFVSLQENALVSIISRDDLQMDEVKVWNHIIRWGIAQNPGLPTDLEDWSNENFLALKTTLQNCLPHIRYFRMSVSNILTNVKPFYQIFEKNVWYDIVKNSMTPNQSISSKLPIIDIDTFSTIINEAHAAEIASWIDKEAITYSVTDSPYEFKLLLRGTRDDFTSNSFWNLCERQTHLVVVMKVKGTDEILGGYNPIGWGNGYYHRTCYDSFIFSLKNGTIQNSILSRVIQPEHAIYCNSDSGPCFGGGCDLGMSNNFNQDKTCWSRHLSYEKLIRNESAFHNEGISWFSIEEYEIFQISKKS